ncbi:hypothetical protein ANOM_002243 [Aspergillus nomiae NRRL 13137]|uniref:DUF7770 domain-containing protein n=1 Tax=Aspergillus nomiae NRRL (strain ATCC 15546 / NRRL 13137 / CBS 260.88 / M93) TaxID=1509407 RepID=A0A0L1JCP9_ASPN3|nr:uncharacterized protein ANOM_002243 [Aspergillus nomiae NRRL 13137]KNG89487.1 hypothetical protein ANOM_002243 [Aspergillus nomiae NRRL 13137]
MSTSPIYYIPPSRAPQILSTKILRIIASPHAQVPVETTKRTNHWCFYLCTSETTCVALDCQPSHTVPSSVLAGGSKAYVLLSELRALAGPDALLEFAVRVDVRAGLTVGDVVDVLVESGRERYEFDADGVGCRFWVTEVLELLLRVGVLVDAQQVERAKGMVKRLWPEGTGLDLDRGAYY